ncbi:hypothetical protein N2152v2_002167 [Parachlorella kessleri]
MEKLFLGCIFYADLEGLQEVEVVQPLLNFIGRYGGHTCQSLPEATHVLLWHRQQATYGAALAAGKATVSPVWVYACLEAGKLLPTGQKLYRPFPAAGLPAVLQHPANYVGCISSFTGPNRWSALMLLACMGMRVSKSLTPFGAGRNTHLVVASVAENSDKAQAARAHNMHILSLRWPLDCLLEWRLLPEDAYTGDAADCSLVMPTADPGPVVEAANSQAEGAAPAHQAVPDSDNDSQGTGRAGTGRDVQGPMGPSRLGPGGSAAPFQRVEATGLEPAANEQQHREELPQDRAVLGQAMAAAAGAELVIPSSTATGALSRLASPSTAALRPWGVGPALAQLPGWRPQQQGLAGGVPAASPSPTYPAPARIPPTARVPSSHTAAFPQLPSRLGRGPGSAHGDSVLAAAVEAVAHQEASHHAGHGQQQQLGAEPLRAVAALDLQPASRTAKPAASGVSQGSGRAVSGLSNGGNAKSGQDPSLSNKGGVSQALGKVGNFLEGMGVFSEAQNLRLENLADIFKPQQHAAARGLDSTGQHAAKIAASASAAAVAVGPPGALNGSGEIGMGGSGVAAVSGSVDGEGVKKAALGGPRALPAAEVDDKDDTTPPVPPPKPASTVIVEDDHPPRSHQPPAAVGVAGAGSGPIAGSSKGGREQQDEATSPEKPPPQHLPPCVTLQHRHQQQPQQQWQQQQQKAAEGAPDGLPHPAAGQAALQQQPQLMQHQQQGRSSRSLSPPVPLGYHPDASPPVGAGPLANPALQRVRTAQRGTPSTGGSGRSARSKSRSATPEPGSARYGRRKGAVERAPFSQQLPQANEKELKSLKKMMAKSEKDKEKLTRQEARQQQLVGGEKGRAGASGRGGRGRRGGRGGGRGRYGSRQASPTAGAAAAEPFLEAAAGHALLAAHGGRHAAAEQPLAEHEADHGRARPALAQEQPEQQQPQQAAWPRDAANAAAGVAAAVQEDPECESGVASGATSSSSGSDDEGQGAAGDFYSPVEELPHTVDGIVPDEPDPQAAQPLRAVNNGEALDHACLAAAAGPAALEPPAGDGHAAIASVPPAQAPAAEPAVAAAEGAGAVLAEQPEFSDQGGLSAAAEQPDYGDADYGDYVSNGGIGSHGAKAGPAGDGVNSRMQEAAQAVAPAPIAAAAEAAPLAPIRRSRKAASPRKLDSLLALPPKQAAAALPAAQPEGAGAPQQPGNEQQPAGRARPAMGRRPRGRASCEGGNGTLGAVSGGLSKAATAVAAASIVPAELTGPANDSGQEDGHALTGSFLKVAAEEDGITLVPAAKRQKGAGGKGKAASKASEDAPAGKASGKRPRHPRQQAAAEVSNDGPGASNGIAAEEKEQQPVGKRRKGGGTGASKSPAEEGKAGRLSSGRQSQRQEQHQADEGDPRQPTQRSGRTRGAALVAAAGTAAARAAISACLALSGFSTKEQKELSAVLEALKVKCVLGKRSHNWNPSVTHVVAPGLKRNQKCMAGLAAGLWLVGREYVAACSAAGDMVAPDDYELSEGLRGLISPGVAAHWRQRKERLGVGAFHGWQVYVCEQLDEPAPTYLDTCNIIKAGGGRVLPQKNWRGASSSVDLVVAHSKARPGGGDALLEALMDSGALCVSSAFIVEWLAKPQAPLGQHVLLGTGGGGGTSGNGKRGRGGARQQGEEHWLLVQARKRGSLDGSEVEYEEEGGWEGPPSPTL